MSESHFEKARQWLRVHNTLAPPARAGVQRLTWEDVDAFIRDQEFDRDEYFEPHTVFRHHHADWQKEFVYADNIRWIAVYWVVGGSEGYYAMGRP